MKDKLSLRISSALLGIMIISGFTSNNTSFIDNSPEILNKNATHSTYTYRSLLNSTTTSSMYIIESSSKVTITTSNVTPNSTDSTYSFYDNSINLEGYSKFSTSTSHATWVVPFDGSVPIQIANIGGGGGGVNCYQQYCPCASNRVCGSNMCTLDQQIVGANGVEWRCSKITGGENEPCSSPDRCSLILCKIQCEGGGIISTTFDGPAFIIESDTLIFNGNTYH